MTSIAYTQVTMSRYHPTADRNPGHEAPTNQWTTEIAERRAPMLLGERMFYSWRENRQRKEAGWQQQQAERGQLHRQHDEAMARWQQQKQQQRRMAAAMRYQPPTDVTDILNEDTEDETDSSQQPTSTNGTSPTNNRSEGGGAVRGERGSCGWEALRLKACQMQPCPHSRAVMVCSVQPLLCALDVQNPTSSVDAHQPRALPGAALPG